MQVSWIDREQLASLLQSLRDAPEASPGDEMPAWEWHTLPEALPAAQVEPVGGAFIAPPGEVPGQAGQTTAPAAPEPLFGPSSARGVGRELGEAPPLPGPEIDLIRSRLQSIKQRAMAAGILSRQPTPPVAEAPAAPEPAASTPGPEEVPREVPAEEEGEEPAALAEGDPYAGEPDPPESPFDGGEPAWPDRVAELETPVDEYDAPPVVSPFGIAAAPVAEEAPIALEPPAAEAPDEPVDESFEVPLGSISERLDAYAQWAMRRMGTDQLVIVDEHGDLVWGTEACPGLVLSAMMAWTSALHGSALSACDLPPVIHRQLPSGELMAVIPCRTRIGDLQVAALRPAALAEDEAIVLSDALSDALDIGTEADAGSEVL